MHFNIYIDDQLGNELSSYAKRLGVTRNRVIREALASYITNTNKKWPDAVAKFNGIKDFPAFEESRKELKADPNEDPFA